MLVTVDHWVNAARTASWACALLRVWFGPGGSGVSPIKPLPNAYVKSRRYQWPSPARRVSIVRAGLRVPHARVIVARVTSPLGTFTVRVSLSLILMQRVSCLGLRQ